MMKYVALLAVPNTRDLGRLQEYLWEFAKFLAPYREGACKTKIITWYREYTEIAATELAGILNAELYRNAVWGSNRDHRGQADRFLAHFHNEVDMLVFVAEPAAILGLGEHILACLHKQPQRIKEDICALAIDMESRSAVTPASDRLHAAQLKKAEQRYVTMLSEEQIKTTA